MIFGTFNPWTASSTPRTFPRCRLGRTPLTLGSLKSFSFHLSKLNHHISVTIFPNLFIYHLRCYIVNPVVKAHDQVLEIHR